MNDWAVVTILREQGLIIANLVVVWLNISRLY